MAELQDILEPSELEDFVREEIRSKLKEKNLEYRTKIVEEAMTPLIDEVMSLSQHSLIGGRRDQKKKKQEPQKLSKLIQLVDMATRNFLAIGEDIAHENPDFQEELITACDSVRACGESLQAAAAEFSQSPCEPDNRSNMTKASRELLISVTRLMVVADMVDVQNLLEASSRVEVRLKSLHTATTEKELMDKIMNCSTDITYIIQRASIQSIQGSSEASLQLMRGAQLELSRARRMLTGTSKAFIQFTGARTAQENQEYVVVRLLDSLKTLSLLASGDEASFTDIIKAEPGALAVCFKNFKDTLEQTISLGLVLDPSASKTQAHITELQAELDKILNLTSEVASSNSTRSYRQHSLITLCGQLKAHMAHLETALMREEPAEREGVVHQLVTEMREQGVELRKELCRAAIDQVTDVFIGTLRPLVAMCEAAQEGQSQLLENRAETFSDHLNSMQKAVLLSCSLSDFAKSNQVANNAVKNIRVLTPQVINAAYSLARKPSSIVALKCMSVFKEAWAENVSALTDAVDDITSLEDFMAVTEAHICKDGQQFIVATEACNTRLLGNLVEIIRGKCKRLCHVVKAELKKNKSSYTKEQIHQSHGAIEKLILKSISQFCDLASKTSETLHMTRDLHRVDFKALEEALQKVVDNVRNVRRSVLVTRAPEEFEGNESDLEDLLRPPRPMTPTPSLLSQISTGSAGTLLSASGSTHKFQRTPRHSMVFEVEDTAKALMAQLPQEQRAHLTKVTEGLTAQQAAFEAEVSKWDESENNIVLIAKEMCGMMVDMSDFTKGIGPLHSTMDVIVTARDIVRAAGILDGVARSIADHCPDAQCQRDIYSYLDQIRLYCHQLSITANVKADLKPSSTDTVETASTLITTSKNLMNAVVETVKTCYIAATAIARIHGGAVSDQFVQWRLTLPRKKKLYWSESEVSAGATGAGSAAVYELGKFKQGRLREKHNIMSTVTALTEIPYEM